MGWDLWLQKWLRKWLQVDAKVLSLYVKKWQKFSVRIIFGEICVKLI